MGYTHYWYRPAELDPEKFKQFVIDVRKIIVYSEDVLGIKLADGINESEFPVASFEEVWFNGSENQPIGQWTTTEKISIPWPDESAALDTATPDPISEKVVGSWFAGELLSQRTAPIDQKTGKGSGSYETIHIPRVYEVAEWEKPDNGLFFSCCKTAYRPYDLTVTAVLIALKHHFPECRVASDGEAENWLDGQILCETVLGYGRDFSI